MRFAYFLKGYILTFLFTRQAWHDYTDGITVILDIMELPETQWQS